jgi:hypothetical protein
MKDGRVHVRELDPELLRAQEIISAVFETGGASTEKSFKGFRVKACDEGELVSLFRSTPIAAQFIATCIATNIQMGIPLDGFFKIIGTNLVAGTLRRPSVPPVKPTVEHRDTLLVHLVDRIHDELGIPGGASKTKFGKGSRPPVRGCTIAAAAMSALGISISANTSVEVWQNRKSDLLKTGAIASRNILLVSQADITEKSIERCRSSSEFAKAKGFLSTPI